VTTPRVSLHGVALTRLTVHGHSRDDRTVLDKVDLVINDGERVGVIGRNGAGKTTLLRIMAGVLLPDQGACERFGHLRAFLDLGYGLEPELSGRANSLSRAVIDELPVSERDGFVAWVESFSELGGQFEQPLKSYSTGMLARLVFSMCTYSTPEILLIDEGIGTVDAHFREKALSRLNEIYGGTSALVLATHDEVLLQQLCTRGIVIHQGRLVFDGSLTDALDHYSIMS